MLTPFALPVTFLGTLNRSRDAKFTIAGVPLDTGVTYRSGSRFGPAAIRAASRMLVDGQNPTGWAEPGLMDIADIGDFPVLICDMPASLAAIEQAASGLNHLIALGGEHGVTLPLLRALAKRLGRPVNLIHFDAHIDTWPGDPAQPYNHGAVFRHAIEEKLVNPRGMIQIGLRSPVPRDVVEWTAGHGVTMLSADDVHMSNPAAIAGRIRDIVHSGPTYLSIDIDCLDPSQAPGTGTPEIGGLFTWQVMSILRKLEGIDFVGMDVVEVLPAHDNNEITALAAATFAWQYLSLVGGAG